MQLLPQREADESSIPPLKALGGKPRSSNRALMVSKFL